MPELVSLTVVAGRELDPFLVRDVTGLPFLHLPSLPLLTLRCDGCVYSNHPLSFNHHLSEGL
jgi:hypothetical protein